MEDKQRRKIKRKMSKAYTLKIVTAVILACFVSALCVVLLMSIFKDEVIIGKIFKETETEDTTKPADIQLSDGSKAKPVNLTAEYTGRVLYSGEKAEKSDFVVKAEYDNGNVLEVTDYQCDLLDNDSDLEIGSNSYIFKYDDLSAVVTVDVLDSSELMYPPDCITVKTDDKAAQEKINKIKNGEMTFEEAFADVVFTGDSQIKALSSFGLIPDSSLVAKVGMGYEYFEQNIDQVIDMARDKKVLVVHYGINSLNTSETDRARCIEKYKTLLERIHNELPDLRILVSGVFPVSYTIFTQQPRFTYITEFDFAIFSMCTSIGVEYISDNMYISQHPESFGSDGLHMTKEFYSEYWLYSLIEKAGI